MCCYMKTAFTNLFLIFFTGTCLAFDSTTVKHLGIEQGLSNNSVTCIYQDHNGFMWFGTYDGLNRYDGYEFKVFKKQPGDSNSLHYNRISTLTEDTGHKLWIGTLGGVSIYDPVSSRFSTLNYQPANGGAKEKILSRINVIKADKHGNVFIATASTGLIMYNDSNASTYQVSFNKKTDYDVSAIEIDEQNNIWLFIRNEGLCKYNIATKVITAVNNTIKTANCLKADNRGNIFIGTDSSVDKLNVATNTLTQTSSTGYKVLQLTIQQNNNLWISTDGGGIFIINANNNTTYSFNELSKDISLSSSAVYDVYLDKHERIWIGTLRGGINVIDPQSNRFKTIRRDALSKNTLSNNFVSSFCEDENHNVWVGTDGGGLNYWNRVENTFVSYKHQHSDPRSIGGNLITSLLTDREKELWVSTWDGGVSRFNKQTKTFERFKCFNTSTNKDEISVWKLYEDKQGVLWASTFNPGALYYFDRNKQSFELFDEKLVEIIMITEDRDGTFWVGDHTSLIKIDKTAKNHKRYNIGSRVRTIYEDKAGRFWLGTEDAGLLLFNKVEGTFVRYSEKEGLCSNAILNILEDKNGNLWISTFHGLSRFDPVLQKITNYFQSDGLQSNQFLYNSALALQSGEFLFGGIEGFNIFYPEKITVTDIVSPVLISDVKLNNSTIQLYKNYITQQHADKIEEIKLPFDKASISLSFLIPEYTSPDKINYAYYLEGRDDDWIFTGKNRTVNFSGLREGKYTLKVKATNTDGIWGAPTQGLTIIVLPPWYRTWWAYLLYIAAVGSIIYVYIKYKVQKERLTYEVAWTKMKAEKEKELNEKKLHFFTNVSHEFRSPLTLIINPLKEVLYNPKQNSGVNELGVVYRNAKRLLSLVDQLLLFQKADTEADKLTITRQNFSALCREVYICFSYLAHSKNISYEFICPNPSIELAVDREKMEIILFNLLSNALKFTPNGGEITFIVEENDDMVRLKITDTGCGIDEQAGQELFERFYQGNNKHAISQSGFGIGLYLVKQFVNAHKGEITYKSEINKGTQFEIVLKKGTAHLDGLYIHEEMEEQPMFLHELLGENIAMEEVEQTQIAKPEWRDLFSDKKTILLVDDNIEIRQYLSQIFEEKFIVHEAENAETGWDIATQYLPDIIISDVIMGEMTGVEFCRKLKESPALKHIPVILLTASLSSDIKLNGLECGADDYITKPFEKDLLIARVANILKNRSTLQQYFFDRITLQKSNTKVSGIHKEFLEKCITVVEKNIDNEEFTIKMLMKEMNLSHSGLYKKVKAISGESINAFIRLIRLRKAAVLLLSTDINISEAAFKVGMSDAKYFRQQFVKLFGMPPSEYVKKYKSCFDKEFNVMAASKK